MAPSTHLKETFPHVREWDANTTLSQTLLHREAIATGTWTSQMQSIPPETSTPEMKWRIGDVAANEEKGRKNVSLLYCLVCFSFSMWWQSLSAGPSLSPMYFMMMSLRSNISALPSISWGERKWAPRIKIWEYDRHFLSGQFNQWLIAGDRELREVVVKVSLE